MKVYLAGKISHGDWRNEFVATIDDVCDEPAYDCNWPVLKNAVAGCIDYTGPFFMNMNYGGHGQCHGRNTHGNGLSSFDMKNGGYLDNRVFVHKKCLNAVRSSDVVIVRLEPECYGTMVEVGYAMAFGKRIYISFECLPYADEWHENDFWFASCRTMRADTVGIAIDFLVSEVELQNRINLLHLCESPVEKSFFTEACNRGLDIRPQVQINEYRVDFANEKLKVVIEIDGHQFHSSKEQIRRDLQRQRSLEMCGWRVHRFSGSEVYTNVGNCVEQCITLMDVRRKELQSV